MATKEKHIKNRTGVKKIVLEVNGKELHLSLEAARELKDALGEILGENVKHVHHYDYWRWPYYTPTITWGATTLVPDSVTTSGGTFYLSCTNTDGGGTEIRDVSV